MSEVIIKVRDDGSLRVEGPVTLVDAEGNPFPLEEGTVIALCRCGHSQSKPFCDRSHREVGFSSRPRAPRPDEEEEVEGGGTAGA